MVFDASAPAVGASEEILGDGWIWGIWRLETTGIFPTKYTMTKWVMYCYQEGKLIFFLRSVLMDNIPKKKNTIGGTINQKVAGSDGQNR